MEIIIWIIIGLIGLGIILALLMVFIYKRKFSGIKHYENIRDKLTIRKKNKSLTSQSIDDSSMLSDLMMVAISLISVGITLAIGMSITNEINTQITNSTTTFDALTQANEGFINIGNTLPMLFTLVIAVSIIGIITRFIGNFRE